MSQKLSEIIFSNLLADAETFKRPKVRFDTLDRLKGACDAIESGKAKNLIAEKQGYRLASELAITPSNIDRYVRAQKWSGPTRSTIEKNDGERSLKPYVQAREDERAKTIIRSPRRPSQELENVLREINSIEARQYVRGLHEQRKAAEARYAALKSGIEKMPAISVEEILGVSKAKKDPLAPQSSSGINSADRRSLGEIYENSQTCFFLAKTLI
nr:hypothetical protein [uncultured Cohaesibacter sp.]